MVDCIVVSGETKIHADSKLLKASCNMTDQTKSVNTTSPVTESSGFEPLFGLPASLLKIEGSTLAIFSLLQAKGLNREIKRRLADGDAHLNHGSKRQILGDLPNILSDLDNQILSLWFNPDTNFSNFWNAIEPPRRGQLRLGVLKYVTAIPLVLLDAFDLGWKSLVLDEDALTMDCPVWPEIRASMENILMSGGGKRKLNFGVFMLWPRIVNELKSWIELDAGRREIVGRAVFALSSISMTDWFAREAVRICPDLKDEFFLAGQDPISSYDTAHEEDGGNGVLEKKSFEHLWKNLLARLEKLSEELCQTPTQDTVTDLQNLAAEFGQLASGLPAVGKSNQELLRENIEILLEECRRLAHDPGFEWLDTGMLEQIDARWNIALRDAGGEVLIFLSDAGEAMARVQVAAEAVSRLAYGIALAEKDVDLATEDLAQATNAAKKRALEQVKREKKKALLVLEEDLGSVQDDFLAACSPFGESFNLATNYQALLIGEPFGDVAPEADLTPVAEGTVAATELSSVDLKMEDIVTHEATNAVADPATAPISGELQSERADSHVPCAPSAPPVLAPLPGVPEETAASRNESLTSDSSPTWETAVTTKVYREPMSTPSDEAVPPLCLAFDDATGQLDNDYSIQSGEGSLLVWKLIGDGRFSMACQLVKAIAAQNNPPVMPPLPLLQAIAFANSLMLSDGNLHDAVTDILQDISEDWFRENGSHSWLPALNLLLVAATLRPMVLAPDSGASVIAGYLHLDSQGRYSALWSLVASLRETSERLRGFRIDLASLRSAKDQAAIATGLEAIRQEASVWLKNQAPAITIKYAAATKVWLKWLRPNGVIQSLVSPIIENDEAKADEVKCLIKKLTDIASFAKLVRKTDRDENGRRKGEEIHTGALDHLGRCSEEAISLARRWLHFVEVSSESNDRMRELLVHLRKNIDRLAPAVRMELDLHDGGRWQPVASAQNAVLLEFEALCKLFDPNCPLSVVEPTADEVLARDLLEVPAVRVATGWVVESAAPDISAAIREWTESPVTWRMAFDKRLDRGDLLGASGLVARYDIGVEELDLKAQLRREADSWRAKLKSQLQETRRDVEVGLAYGYVSDAERNQWEGDLVGIEAQYEDSTRFDVAREAVERIRKAVRANHAEKSEIIRLNIEGLVADGREENDIQAVQASLDEGDMATANELLQRVRQGLPAWPKEVVASDSFLSFSGCFGELDGWLSQRRSPEDIRFAIKSGNIPGLNFSNVAGAQRDQAASMFSDWSFLKSRKEGNPGKLRSLLGAVGFGLGTPPTRKESGTGKEVWTLSIEPIGDRQVCPIPHFGSSARGVYRLICLWERPTEDDIVQSVGDSNLHRATIVLYFGRMTERKWRDLSHKTKLNRRSFVLIDETMLLFLAAQSGSRLAALFSTSLPFGYSDPFDATAGFVPPEMFYGRSTELDAILGLNGRCFIYGGRQLGKTALMRRAEQTFHAPAMSRWAYYIDLRAEGVGVNRTAAEVWQTFGAAMASIDVLPEQPTAAELAKKTGIDALLEKIVAFLNKGDERRILLLLDEADRFFEQDGRHDFAETRRLKQLMDTTQRRFKVIFAGLHNVLRMTERANHPLAHFGQPIKIGPFIEEHEIREARELIRRPLAATGFEFDSRSLVLRILAQTNYYPSLIQLYCNHLLQHMLTRLDNAPRLAGPRYRITNHDIEAVYSSNDMRGEIRTKFNFTLQLDPRYEVTAYGMAYEALGGRCDNTNGMDWRSIWLDCAMTWWPEGFRDTSELDFRVLLDEMVELGVLSRPSAGRYGLRNPNVFLLLGNRDEIETVLARSRQPAVEFDSATFHPQLHTGKDTYVRHPLTYQQLSEIVRPANTITVVAGIPAAGINGLAGHLQTYVEESRAGSFDIMDITGDHNLFSVTLKGLLDTRAKDGLTLIVVPSSSSWNGLWVKEAKKLLGRLNSPTRFVSLTFIAAPATLWSNLQDDSFKNMDIPWTSLLPWRDTFVRQYLEDLQLLSASTALISKATGNWSGLLYPLVENCTQVRELERRTQSALSEFTALGEGTLLQAFGLDVEASWPVLSTLADLAQCVEEADLAEFTGMPKLSMQRVLLWGELLGLVRREGSEYWRPDKVVERVILASKAC
jgi:hypothetical protein